MAHQGGADRLRRRADVVRARRPRHRHAPRPHPHARGRLPAQRRHRRAVPAMGRAASGCCRCPTTAARPTSSSSSTARRRAIHFQEWWVRHRAQPAGARRSCRSASTTPNRAAACSRRSPAPTSCSSRRATRSSRSAPCSGCPRSARRSSTAPRRWSGVSPIIGGAPVRGMADACLPAIGVEVSAEGVGRHYGARSAGGLLDGWLIHDTDTADVPGVRGRGRAAADDRRRRHRRDGASGAGGRVGA